MEKFVSKSGQSDKILHARKIAKRPTTHHQAQKPEPPSKELSEIERIKSDIDSPDVLPAVKAKLRKELKTLEN